MAQILKELTDLAKQLGGNDLNFWENLNLGYSSDALSKTAIFDSVQSKLLSEAINFSNQVKLLRLLTRILILIMLHRISKKFMLIMPTATTYSLQVKLSVIQQITLQAQQQELMTKMMPQPEQEQPE